MLKGHKLTVGNTLLFFIFLIMHFRFFIATLILLVALAAQMALGAMGISVNLLFAALVADAFVFSGWGLALLVLLAVFLVNWQPSLSLPIVVFAAIPFIALFFRTIVTWTPVAGIPFTIVLGLAILYGAFASTLFFVAPLSVLLDGVGSVLFGELVFMALSVAER